MNKIHNNTTSAIHDIDDNALKNKLKYLREKYNETQEQLAEAIGINNAQTVSNWERITYKNHKDTRISLNNLYKVAQHYNVSIDWLLGSSEKDVNEYADSTIGERSLKLSLQSVCRVIEHWYRCGRIDIVQIPYSEWFRYYEPGEKLFSEKKITDTHFALVFKKYAHYRKRVINDKILFEDEHESVSNNIEEGYQINAFLEQVSSLFSTYIKRILSRTNYNYCISGILAAQKNTLDSALISDNSSSNIIGTSWAALSKDCSNTLQINYLIEQTQIKNGSDTATPSQ